MMDDKEHCYHDFPDMPTLTIIPWVIWAVVVGIAIAGVVYSAKALAEPMYRTEQGGVVITLHSEKCALPEVSNLPNRATWEENGKTYEGCFGVQPAMRAVMLYFVTDRTVAVAPASIFTKVSGA